ncbi:flagellar biosynthesis protein FlhA [Candidatus Magnetomoraceae bacterium gMMP-15]
MATLALKDLIGSDSANAVMVLGVVGILVVMIIPLPSFLIDFLLAVNITLSIIIMITSMYALKPVDFFIFPSLLLVVTLFRLSLNVATTRVILLHGNEGPGAAGAVIQSFGNFVVGGNYVVGVVIFIILVAINFIVITKGATRIAEVAARFTLDAMPGKQMAIDADLNAGIIDESEARQRREEIKKESEFHGAMDGAGKFVRGDAVAGIVITFVNIIGGFIIGVLQQGMPAAVAAENYTLLTIGDGLVSQIPALIISTSTGILVSRSASEDTMGNEFKKQLFTNTAAVYIGSGVIFLFGLIPGLPHVPFLFLGSALAGTVYFFDKKKEIIEIEEAAAEAEKEEVEEQGPEPVEHLLSVDPMEMEVGYGIIPLVDRGQDGELLDRIRSIRRQFAIDMGLVIPPIHIRDNLKLKPSEYRILIKGCEVGKYELMMNHLLAMDPGNISQKMEGIDTKEPAFELPALWIPDGQKEEARFAGYTVVDNASVIATHITSVIRRHADELLGRQDVQYLIDNLAKTYPKVVEELIPNLLGLGSIQKVLQNLVSEGVSVRDLLSVVETLADYAVITKDPDILTEYVRQKLARVIVSPHLAEDGTLPVITLAQDIEEILLKNIQHTEHGSYLSVEPGLANIIMESVSKETEKVMTMGYQPIVLCSPVLRRHFRKMIEQFAPSLMVFSQGELLSNMRFKSLGKVRSGNAG